MDTLFIPNENDFRRWIREALKEYLENIPVKEGSSTDPQQEPLLTRKEIAGVFRVSLVTLHEWMKQGLPFHKQGGRVYFLRSEVLEYLKQKRNPQANSPVMSRITATAAKQLDLVDYLASLGFQPEKVRNQDYWYRSPLREEKTASFKVDRAKRLWYDHGTGQGGTIIDFGMAYFR